jgi:hypothetical protein
MAASASASSSSADPSMRVPQLASASSTAGLAYALWRPQMQSHLMRQGVEERDYTEDIPEWKALIVAVQTDARAAERAAIDTLLGRAPQGSSSTTMTPATAASAQQQAITGEAAKKAVSARALAEGVRLPVRCAADRPPPAGCGCATRLRLRHLVVPRAQVP